MESKMRNVMCWIAGTGFTAAGVMHFVRPEFYERIVPPSFPSPSALVTISGVAEIAGGLGLLVPLLRRAAAWGLIALLVAVLPANLYMAIHADRFADIASPPTLWLRLPFQPLMAAWIWFSAIKTVAPERTTVAS